MGQDSITLGHPEQNSLDEVVAQVLGPARLAVVRPAALTGKRYHPVLRARPDWRQFAIPPKTENALVHETPRPGLDYTSSVA